MEDFQQILEIPDLVRYRRRTHQNLQSGGNRGILKFLNSNVGTKVVFLRVLLVTLRGNLRVLVPVPVLTPKLPRILVRLKKPGILEIYRILESAKECEIPVRVHIGQGERLQWSRTYTE
jgi:hypothetical protein